MDATEHPRSQLQLYFDRLTQRLTAEGAEARSFDHGTNRGHLREAFIRELLSHNTSPMTGVGTGEILHPGCSLDEQRHQIDVVIHSNRFPKLSLAVGIDLFFGETVSSFVEIKSNLTKTHVRDAARTAKTIKSNLKLKPQRFNPTGMVKKPRPYSFVFAYDGPSRIDTVLKWMKEVSAEDEYGLGELRKTTAQDRQYFRHLFVDGVFVLGKGYVHLDVLPFGSAIESLSSQGIDASLDHIWISQDKDELLTLWLLINELSEKYLWNDVDLTEYVNAHRRTLHD